MVSVAAMPTPAAGNAAAPIRIRLFAALREQAGWSDRLWPVPEDATPPITPRHLWRSLQLPGVLTDVRVAINQQFASTETPLQPGDELAFLPPISGG